MISLIFKIIKSVIFLAIVAYGVLWVFSFKTYDVDLGISYSPQYARYLGLDSAATFDAILSDLNPSTIRLAVPWSEVESVKGVFDFKEVDEMLAKSKENNTKVILVIGQKVPRWPECFIPAWAEELNTDERKIALMEYLKESVGHYQNDSTVEFWQVENEPFIRFVFGECSKFNNSWVKEEVELVKSLDPSRQVIITDSGELSTFRRPSFRGDVLGTTLYRTTRTFGGIILSYDWLPPAFYKAKARIWDNDKNHFFVSELQAEPWFENGLPTNKEDFAKEETFSTERFVENVDYAKKTGASRAYLWGAEWWYFMKTKIGDDSYWETAKQIFQKEN